MAYTVYESNLAQSANQAAGNAVAAEITATGSTDGVVETYNTIFDAAFKKLKDIFENDTAAKQAGEQEQKRSANKQQADSDPGSVAFNFGAFKGKSVAEVAEMSAADAEAHGKALVEAGWTGEPYKKSGLEYLEYVKKSSNKKLGFMQKVVNSFFDSRRA